MSEHHEQPKVYIKREGEYRFTRRHWDGYIPNGSWSDWIKKNRDMLSLSTGDEILMITSEVAYQYRVTVPAPPIQIERIS